MNDAPPFTIRPAAPTDADVIASMTRELLAFETGGDTAMETALLFLAGPGGPLRENLFGGGGGASAHVACEADGAVFGFALTCPFHSAFSVRPGRLMEGLYVRESHRGAGAGRALLAAAARDAAADGGFLEWRVQRRNRVGERFYAGLGAKRIDSFRAYRFDGAALQRIAADWPAGA